MSSASNEVFDRLRDVEKNNLRNELAIGSHEKECALRYQHINSTMGAIKRDIRWAAIALITGLAGVRVKLLVFPS